MYLLDVSSISGLRSEPWRNKVSFLGAIVRHDTGSWLGMKPVKNQNNSLQYLTLLLLNQTHKAKLF